MTIPYPFGPGYGSDPFYKKLQADLEDLDTRIATLEGTTTFGVSQYAGLNAGSWDSRYLYFNAGSFADAVGSVMYQSLDLLWFDSGAVGVYTAVPPDGGASTVIGGMAEGAPADPVPIQFFAITRDSDSKVAVLGSSFINYGDVAPYIPVGWTLQRKLHFSVVYATGRGANWNGLPDFFTEVVGTRTHLTGAGDDANYKILNAGAALTPTLQSAATFFGDANRTVELYCQVSSTGAGGFAVIGSGTGNGFTIYVPDGFTTVSFVVTKLDSVRNFEYYTLNAELTVFAKSYWFDDPT